MGHHHLLRSQALSPLVIIFSASPRPSRSARGFIHHAKALKLNFRPVQFFLYESETAAKAFVPDCVCNNWRNVDLTTFGQVLPKLAGCVHWIAPVDVSAVNEQHLPSVNPIAMYCYACQVRIRVSKASKLEPELHCGDHSVDGSLVSP